jgi:hypothetical protein
MKSKYLNKDRIFEMPYYILPECNYPKNRVFERHGKYVIFTGKVNENAPTDCVIHGQLSDYNALCLRIIYSYGLEITDFQYKKAFKMLLMHDQNIKIDAFANRICADPDWIRKILQISDSINLKEVCVLNAYTLSVLGDKATDTIRNQASLLTVNEFIPICREREKECRVEKKKLKR